MPDPIHTRHHIAHTLGDPQIKTFDTRCPRRMEYRCLGWGGEEISCRCSRYSSNWRIGYHSSSDSILAVFPYIFHDRKPFANAEMFVREPRLAPSSDRNPSSLDFVPDSVDNMRQHLVDIAIHYTFCALVPKIDNSSGHGSITVRRSIASSTSSLQKVETQTTARFNPPVWPPIVQRGMTFRRSRHGSTGNATRRLEGLRK